MAKNNDNLDDDQSTLEPTEANVQPDLSSASSDALEKQIEAEVEKELAKLDEVEKPEPQAIVSEAKEEIKEDKPAPEADEGQAEESKEPLIDGKFKSQEDLIKSYHEIEKRATQADQLKAHYRDVMSPYVEFDEDGKVNQFKQTYQQPQQEPQQGQAQQEQILAGLEQRYNAYEQQYGPVRANIMLQADIARATAEHMVNPLIENQSSTVADKEFDKQINSLRQRKNDFAKYEKEIRKHSEKLPAASKRNPNAAETLYYMMRGRELETDAERISQEAQGKAAEIEKLKSQAQVEQQTRTPEEPTPNINSLSSEEMKRSFGLKEIIE